MSYMQFSVPVPRKLYPIVIIGAGGIVNDAHLPAYKIAGFPVAGIYDIQKDKAIAAARKFDIPAVYENVEQILQKVPEGIVFDMALPGSEIIAMLQKLPDGAAVLMQKPMGNNLGDAKQILRIARDKKMIAGVNFQLRYAPFIIAARDMIQHGMIGDVCDIEVNVNCYTPWQLWDFMAGIPRVEILYHSIHYIDLIRSFLGNPSGMYGKTVKHPGAATLASVRTNIIMDYGDMMRANILTNHCHDYGPSHQHAFVKFEGTKGAIKIKLGVLLNYPKGTPDLFEYVIREEGKEPEWKTMEIEGTWFPHAFIGSMSEVMRAAGGEIADPDNSVEDCIYTMACVEAAYTSSENGSTKLSI